MIPTCYFHEYFHNTFFSSWLFSAWSFLREETVQSTNAIYKAFVNDRAFIKDRARTFVCFTHELLANKVTRRLERNTCKILVLSQVKDLLELHFVKSINNSSNATTTTTK